MTQQEKINFTRLVQDVLKGLTPSWHISKDSRMAIVKILMIFMMMTKLSHRIPLKVLSQASPDRIEINLGADGLSSLTELWDALDPIERAILIFFELQVPHTAEEMLNETSGTLNDFFIQAGNRLVSLPVWSQIEAMALNPNFPTSLPIDANELRVSFTDDGTLTFFVTNDSDETRAISFIADLELYNSVGDVGLDVYAYQSTTEDLEMLDTVTEDVILEVFDLVPAFS